MTATAKVDPYMETAIDIDTPPSLTESIDLVFTESKTVTKIVDKTTNTISGTITSPNDTDHPNIILSKNNLPQNSFVAKKYYIVGNSNNGILTTFKKGNLKYLTDSSGSYHAEFVIEGKNTRTSEICRLCFLLFGGSKGIPGSETLKQLLESNTGSVTINIGDIINGTKKAAELQPSYKSSYIKYSYNNCTYIISTIPITVAAIFVYGNGVNGKSVIDFKKPETYTVITPNDTGDWMECEYAPEGINSPEVKFMQMPVGSIEDLKSEQSFRQIVLFLVFILFLMLAYFVIPPLYTMIIWKLSENNVNVMCTTMSRVDWGYNILLFLLWIILIIAGMKSKEDNASDVVYSGLIIFMIHAITLGTITVSKFSPNFPFEDREKRCAQASSPSSSSYGTGSSARGGMMAYPSSSSGHYSHR